MGNERIRTFIAMPLAESAVAELDRVQRELKKRLQPDTVRWVQPHNLHLTLRFLGYLPADQLQPLENALRPVGNHLPPFRLFLESLGGFPDLHRPRVLWAGLKGDLPSLTELHRRIALAVAGWGEPEEARPFQAHLTIGRVKHAPPQEVQRLAARLTEIKLSDTMEWTVSLFNLMRSDLSPQGPTYHRLASFPLGQ